MSAPYLPPNWESPETRGLFGNMRSKSVDAKQFDKKKQFWSDVIARYCKHSNSAVVDFSTLRKAFTRGDLLPAPLETVLNELYTEGDIKTLDEAQKKSSGWLNWGASMLGFGAKSTDIKATKLVHLPTIEILAANLLEHQETLAASLMDYPEVTGFNDLRRQSQEVIADDETFELVVRYLDEHKMLTQGVTKGGDRILKFREKSAVSIDSVNETDVSIHEIRRAMVKLENDIRRLEDRQERLKADARKAIKEHNKKNALVVLRRKKIIEQEISTKDKQYKSLLDILERLSQTRHTREVMEVYRAGNEAFKDVLQRQGLTPENIDTTVDSIQEIMSDLKEVDDMLANGFQGQKLVDDTELEAELEELIEEETEADKSGRVKVNKHVIDINLPVVPSEEPSPADELEQRLRRLKERA